MPLGFLHDAASGRGSIASEKELADQALQGLEQQRESCSECDLHRPGGLDQC